MHAAMKYRILKTVRDNQIIRRENDATGFTTFVILDNNKKHLMTVYYNWKYQDYFIHTANGETVTEGTMPKSRHAMIAKHQYDLDDIVTACFRKAHNLPRNSQTKRRQTLTNTRNITANTMSPEERARFILLNKSVRVK